MANFEFKGFDNEILENKIESILSTKMDMNRYMTIDYSLTDHPGMIKKIHTYKGSGVAQDLARGEGNTEFFDAEYTVKSYEVSRTQGATRYYDDDQMTDPVLIDTKVQTLSEGMVNNWTEKAIAEFNKTENHAVFSTYGLDDFADALAKYANVYEDESGLFFLADIALVPQLRKKLGEYLQPTEAYIRTGAIGSILSVPIYTSKALPKGMMFLATKEAVKAFMKKNLFVEQDRDKNTKENKIYATRYSVIALVDESKCIKCGKAQDVTATITAPEAADVSVAGAAKTGAKVSAFILNEKSEWVQAGISVVAESNTYEIALGKALAAGDKVKVVAEVEGFLPEIVLAEVAE